MVPRRHKWFSVRSNSFAEHQKLYLNIKSLSITWNISMLWRIVELACGVTWRPCHSFISYAILQLILRPSLYLLIYLTSLYFWWWRPPRLSRRNHQKYKPQMEQQSAGGMTSSNVKTAAKPSHGVVAVLNSLHFAFPYRYCIYSLSFTKASIKTATRLNSTTVAGVLADLDPPVQICQRIWTPQQNWVKTSSLTFS